jgi:hypothetical protein
MASETGHAAHVSAQRVLASAIAPANVVLRVPSFVAGAIVASQTEGVVTLPKNLADIIAGPLGLIAFRTPLQLPRIEHSAAAEAQPEDTDVAARNADRHVWVEHDAQEHQDH